AALERALTELFRRAPPDDLERALTGMHRIGPELASAIADSGALNVEAATLEGAKNVAMEHLAQHLDRGARRVAGSACTESDAGGAFRFPVANRNLGFACRVPDRSRGSAKGGHHEGERGHDPERADRQPGPDDTGCGPADGGHRCGRPPGG